MKEVEFINSQVEQVRSQQQRHQQHHRADDCPPKLDRNTDPTDARMEPGKFTQDQRKIIVSVLDKFTDILAVYRSILDNRILMGKSHGGDEDSERDETLIHFRDIGIYVGDILAELTKDIERNGSYDVLIREIESNRRKQDGEIAIVKDYEETMKMLEELRKRLKDETEANARERKRLETKLLLLKNETKKLKYKVNIEAEFVKAREEARKEAHHLRLCMNRKNLESNLEKLSSMEKNEDRVHKEIVKFLEKNITENENAKSEWEKRCEHEMLLYRSKNEQLIEEIHCKTELLEKLELKYRERQQFIDSYRAEKEAALELKKLEEHRCYRAIEIQAWWRGVMVRKKLGPYRPDEKKKKRAVKSKK